MQVLFNLSLMIKRVALETLQLTLQLFESRIQIILDEINVFSRGNIIHILVVAELKIKLFYLLL